MFRLTYYQRIQVSFVIFILLPIIVVSYLTYTVIEKTMTEKIQLSNQAVTNIIAKDISKMVEDLTFTTDFFLQDSNARKDMRGFGSTKRISNYQEYQNYTEISDLFEVLTNKNKSFNTSFRMFYVNNVGFIIPSTNLLELGTGLNELQAQWRDQLRTRVNKSLINKVQWIGLATPPAGEKGENYYYMARALYDIRDGVQLGTLYIGISERYFNKLFESARIGGISLYDTKGKLIAGKEEIPYTLKPRSSEIRSEVIISKVGWKLVYDMPKEELVGQITGTFYTMIMAILAFSVLFLIVSVIVAKKLYMPIRKLQRVARQFGEGNHAIQFPTEGKDEIALLGLTLNQMLEQIKKLIADIELEQEQKRRLELHALFAQIRPHFLLNTLNSIKCSLLLVDDQFHSQKISSLMRLLRAYMKIDQPSTLQSEGDLLSAYVDIMTMRREIPLAITVNIPTSISSFEMPKLLLQPLVENAILHGSWDSDVEAHIEVDARQQDGILEIRIQDNGNGMGQDRYDAIHHMLEEGSHTQPISSSGVGLVNVRERIRLTYGPSASIRLIPNTPNGVIVIMQLPMSTIDPS